MHTGPEWAPPRWASPAALLLACGGLGVSTYLTVAHYGSSVTLACPDTGVINCEKVTTSPQSVILGVPVAVLGLAFFAAMVVINLPRAWRCPSSIVRVARIGLAAVGVAFAVYLVYTELFTIHAICLWCTSVHVTAFLLFVVALFAESLGRHSTVVP
ncbi:MAG: vitamin K epoxide reductase family protein [Acidimicrobiales bacterium]